ncbi:hypothetical protein JCM15765_43440 [Paradesulfitobacterium aromaticivorans]
MESFLGLSLDPLPGKDESTANRLPLRLYAGLFYLLVGTCFYFYFR